MTGTFRPAFSAASRTCVMMRVASSCEPHVMLMRATSIWCAMSASMVAGSSDEGPRVATICVRDTLAMSDSGETLVFYTTFALVRSACLQTEGPERVCEVRNEIIHGLPAPVAHDAVDIILTGNAHGRECLRERTDLIGLDDDRVDALPFYHAPNAFGIGRREVIADDDKSFSRRAECCEIRVGVFVERILNETEAVSLPYRKIASGQFFRAHERAEYVIAVIRRK